MREGTARKRAALRGPLFRFRLALRLRGRGLQAVEEIGGALRMGGSCENQALVVLQRLEPAGDVAGMVGARFVGQVQVGTDER